jgi:glucan endo-1,3-alpha-glucosidase
MGILSTKGLVRCLMLAPLVFLGARSASGQRLVFAHYMVTNQDDQADNDPTQEAKIAAYEREISQAQAIGIDGFALNVGGWRRETYYIRYSAQMFEAAARLNTGFKLMFSADMCCGNTVDDVEDMMRRFANNPRYAAVYFRYKGRPVLTTFSGDKFGTQFWQQIRNDLAKGANRSLNVVPGVLPDVAAAPGNQRMKIFLVPAFFWGGELPALGDVQKEVAKWSSTIDGAFYWGIAGVPGSGGSLDQLISSRAYADTLHRSGKLYMAPVCLQFWGANANRYYEYSGAAGMRAMWMHAIRTTHPKWVEIITWNDFIEGTYVSPIDDPNRYPGANFLNSRGVPLGTLGYFHSHRAATALLPYFIQWYKTGIEPRIADDTVHYFYRTQRLADNPGTPPVAHQYGPVADMIYLTANLTAAATLRVTSGGHTTTITLQAGSSDVMAPIFAGQPPQLTLCRSDHVIFVESASEPIPAQTEYNNFYYATGTLSTRENLLSSSLPAGCFGPASPSPSP